MSEKVEFENAKAIANSDNAILVKLEDHDEAVWIPNSQVHDDSEVYKRGHEGTLVITEWIAIEKGLV